MNGDNSDNQGNSAGEVFTQMGEKRTLRVGYYLTSKKASKLSSQGLGFFSNHGEVISYPDVPYNIIWQHVDITETAITTANAAQHCCDDESNDLQIDVLLLKVTDWVSAALYSEDHGIREHAQSLLDSLQRWIDSHPHVVVLEPLRYVSPFVSRSDTQKLLESIHFNIDEYTVTVPRGAVVRRRSGDHVTRTFNDLSGMRFPIVCKRIAACGSDASHDMYVITNMNDVQCLPHSGSRENEWLCQEFINHDNIMYKVYVLADECYISTKPSLPNLTPNDPSIHLSSQTMNYHYIGISKVDTLEHKNSANMNDNGIVEEKSSGHLGERGDVKRVTNVSSSLQHALSIVSQQLRSHVNLDMFGYDIVMDAYNPLSLYIVDINYFPSYKQVNDLQYKIVKYIANAYHRRKSSTQSDLHCHQT